MRRPCTQTTVFIQTNVAQHYVSSRRFGQKGSHDAGSPAMHISFIIFKSLTWIEVASEALTNPDGVIAVNAQVDATAGSVRMTSITLYGTCPSMGISALI